MEERFKGLSEVDIFKRVSEDDVNAMEYFYKKYHADLVMYAFKFLGNEDDAKDNVQQLFLAFWERRKNIAIHSSVKSYLISSLRNRLIDHIRKNVHCESLQKETEFLFVEQGNLTLNEMIGEELQKLITDSIQKLPDKTREIFCLNRFEGLKYKKIANEMKISVKTVEYHMGCALKSLREILSHY